MVWYYFRSFALEVALVERQAVVGEGITLGVPRQAEPAPVFPMRQCRHCLRLAVCYAPPPLRCMVYNAIQHCLAGP